MKHIHQIVLFILVAAIESGCVFPICFSTSKHKLTLHLEKDGQPQAGKTISAEILSSDQSERKDTKAVTTTNLSGTANFEFEINWSRGFWVIPPIGPFPFRPKKEEYLISVDQTNIQITPKSPRTSYHWLDSRWQTETELTNP